MKRKILLMLLLAALTFSFCSQKTEEPADKGQNNTKTPTRTRAVAVPKKAIIIKTINFIPAAPTVLHDIIAIPVLADSGLENVNFQYQWFVNNKEVPAATSALLGKVNFKKGALLYCQVKAVSLAGESSWFKSAIIRVNNALPVLNLAPVPAFSVPGIFRYKINASDPDNDELTFMVTAPENEGISLEVESGLLTWKIDRNTVKRLGEAIPINFAVIDNDGGKTSGSITLNIAKTK
jgi:hypothetical protein